MTIDLALSPSPMPLTDHLLSFGRAMQIRHGQRVHKLAIDAGFSCPNRDGSKGRGGCTFCNNRSFSPNGRQPLPIAAQIEAGRQVIRKRTGARRYIAYFQAYTNTYAAVEELRQLYEQALSEPDVIGLSVGTRPDCVPGKVLDLLAGYRDRGLELWLELGLQSSFDHTLERVNRGHGFGEYRDAVRAAHDRGLQVCTHLIIGLPGESREHSLRSLERVLELGTEGLKFHPLHVVKGTQLANSWRRGEYSPLEMSEYVDTVCDLIAMSPSDMIYHRLTGTAPRGLLLAPAWCSLKWRVLNAIEAELKRRGGNHPDAVGGKMPVVASNRPVAIA